MRSNQATLRFFPRPLQLCWPLLALLSSPNAPAAGQICTPFTGPLIGGFAHDTIGGSARTCPPNPFGFFCYDPILLGIDTVTLGGCDPEVASCGVRLTARFKVEGTTGNRTISLQSWTVFDWMKGTTPIGECGRAFGQEILLDFVDTWIQVNFKCNDPAVLGADAGIYTLVGTTCRAVSGTCGQRVRSFPIPVTQDALRGALCSTPPQDDCEHCPACPAGGSSGPGASGGSGGSPGKPGGSSGGPGFRVTGKGASFTPEASGPGALLSYFAGGVGHPGFPGTALHSPALGRYWSHDLAERIVQDTASPNKVWLLTRIGNFRSFTDGNSDGLYEDATPSNEYRKLVKTASEYELRSLDGTTAFFDLQGRWLRNVDRSGNALVGTYNGSGQLISASFPDGRGETLTYHPSGKLASITEVGVGGGSPRTWSYTWSGDDLSRINRPDGTAWVFEYAAAGLPGYMTAMRLEASNGSPRIDRAWEYDTRGNVRYSWRGDASRTGPNATEIWELQYDNEQQPAEVTVIDPLGDPTIYTLERVDPTRPRISRIDGTCPGCGFGGMTTFSYGDPAHPLRATGVVDGEGHQTQTGYDSNGMRTSMTEAAGTAQQRTTLWDYDSNFPAYVTREERVGVQAGTPRVTSWLYDAANGDLEGMTIEGREATIAGGPQFSLTTNYTYHADSGALQSSNPPGYGTSDVVSFTYDSARGDLVPLTRADPLIGTTTFVHDALNRRAAETDPNGTRTETAYDALSRVRFVRVCNVASPSTACPASGPDVLITEHIYDAFGDLFRTILPRGNVIEYGYDGVGRLVRMERKPNTASNGERTLYTLDAAANRALERLERWDGAAWVLDAQTETVYETRCQVRKTVLGKGSAAESVTEYEYDCNGNLEKTWDANHPRALPTTPASATYAYDALDRLTSMTQPWGGAGGGVVTVGYQYDAQDHLTRVTDGEGGITQYIYSDRDLLTSEVSEVSGTSTHRYNGHGQLDRTSDEREIVTTRTVDELDRVTQVTYPDAERNVAYVYDDPAVAYSLGRLTRIARGRTRIDYAYDQYGRMVVDGALAYGLDANGNRSTLTYPNGAVASYGFDFGDRASSVSLSWPESGGMQMATVLTGTSYAASGPLRGLTLGNGLVEEHANDQRYFPDRIRVLNGVAPILDWDYTVDAVGNPTRIDETLDGAGTVHQPSVPRIYGYQDLQYYLTQGDGPWGTLDWTYDRIGNRLSEQRDGGSVEAYTYRPNAAGGRTAVLQTVNVNRVYTFGAAGHLDQVNAAGNVITFDHDDEGRLGGIARQLGESVTADYDGRGFLAEIGGLGSAGLFGDRFGSGDASCWNAVVGGAAGSGPCGPPRIERTEATYSSEGVLHHLRQVGLGLRRDRYVVMFGGRPVAALTIDGGNGVVQYLTTDHLGTPMLATSETGVTEWQGGFEPFGRDWLEGSSSSALSAGVFLRLPGQFEDAAWADATSGAQSYYNLHRWHEFQTGRYTSPDPLGAIRPDREALFTANPLYAYAASSPTFFVDPLGLEVVIENPDTAASYDQLKKCFPLFRQVAEHFENDAWTPFGLDLGLGRTWTVKDPIVYIPTCGVGGMQTETKTIWVPPGEGCRDTMSCLFHEFYELWLKRVAGYKQVGPAGPAHDRAKQAERWIPLGRCCSCDAGGGG